MRVCARARMRVPTKCSMSIRFSLPQDGRRFEIKRSCGKICECSNPVARLSVSMARISVTTFQIPTAIDTASTWSLCRVFPMASVTNPKPPVARQQRLMTRAGRPGSSNYLASRGKANLLKVRTSTFYLRNFFVLVTCVTPAVLATPISVVASARSSVSTAARRVWIKGVGRRCREFAVGEPPRPL